MNLYTDLELIQFMINEMPSNERGQISDGHHTFEELYEFRALYHAMAFNELGKTTMVEIPLNPTTEPTYLTSKYDIHKSHRHHDGELCFGGGWFIVVGMTPEGQVTNHYQNKYWDYFKIPEAPKARYEFDGHDAQDVISRLKSIIREQ